MQVSAGVGLKPEYYESALAEPAGGLWFEVHPENYYAPGGPRLAWLQAIRSRHPVALHSVSLSLGTRIDPLQLERLADLTARIEPFLVTEHLAWSVWRGRYHPDLLPLPRTRESLLRLAANIRQVQDRLGRRIAVENPSHYLRLDQHQMGEVEFLAELARLSGCGLLLDVNNVFVSANNLDFSAEAYVDAFPGDLVEEIHLAGCAHDPNPETALLIDSHDSKVRAPVWRLFQRLIERIGARPTLIERDDRLPPFEELLAERQQAQRLLEAVPGPQGTGGSVAPHD